MKNPEIASEGASREKSPYRFFEQRDTHVAFSLPITEWDLDKLLSAEDRQRFENETDDVREALFPKAIAEYLKRYEEAARKFQNELLVVAESIEAGESLPASFKAVHDANGRIRGVVRAVEFRRQGSNGVPGLFVSAGDYKKEELSVYAERFDELPKFISASMHGNAVIRGNALVHAGVIQEFARLATMREGNDVLLVDEGWLTVHGMDMPRSRPPINEQQSLHTFYIEQSTKDLFSHKKEFEDFLSTCLYSGTFGTLEYEIPRPTLNLGRILDIQAIVTGDMQLLFEEWAKTMTLGLTEHEGANVKMKLSDWNEELYINDDGRMVSIEVEGGNCVAPSSITVNGFMEHIRLPMTVAKLLAVSLSRDHLRLTPFSADEEIHVEEYLESMIEDLPRGHIVGPDWNGGERRKKIRSERRKTQ